MVNQKQFLSRALFFERCGSLKKVVPLDLKQGSNLLLFIILSARRIKFKRLFTLRRGPLAHRLKYPVYISSCRWSALFCFLHAGPFYFTRFKRGLLRLAAGDAFREEDANIAPAAFIDTPSWRLISGLI